MKALCITMLMAMNIAIVFSQHTFKAFIKDAESGEPLVGATATIEGTKSGGSADANGFVEIKNITAGKYTIVFSVVGYEKRMEQFVLPFPADSVVEILLHHEEEELEEVIVSTMRSSRTIADEPTRIEAITGEELGEKSNMKPGDIRMLLSESTGIQTQQTSATTANATIRIQGLDGRYTQILKDGYPLYSGFAGGLSIMQIPPLDLHQVEVIKGSVSTLYGGGAIAGLVNLISKVPSQNREISLFLNATTAGGLDLSGFYGERFEEAGFTLFVSRNSNAPYDPAKIDLTAIPKFERYTINPRLFLYLNDRTTVNIGVSTGFENRLGGDIHFVQGEGDSTHSYFERNTSARISLHVGFEQQVDSHSTFVFKNSVSSFRRLLEIPQYTFDGRQLSSFSEASYSFGEEMSAWIVGANLWTDRFSESKQTGVVPRDYRQTIVGGFIQNTWHASDWLMLETGLRADYAKDYGAFVLPKISLLFRLATNLTSRAGGGLGYKLPTIFTEDAEEIQFRNVLPVDEEKTTAEQSFGASMDVNYRTTVFDAVSFTMNQLFFYTKLNTPLVLREAGGGLVFANANGHLDTKGMETNIKLGFHELKFFLGYTLTDAREHFDGTLRNVPRTPKHRLNTVLIYEVHDEWRIGVEAYYFGRQQLSDGSSGRSYWIFGFMAEKTWKNLSLFVNFENLSDTRQTRFDTIYRGTITQPLFKEIYAPVDGFVANGGIKLRL